VVRPPPKPYQGIRDTEHETESKYQGEDCTKERPNVALETAREGGSLGRYKGERGDKNKKKKKRQKMDKKHRKKKLPWIKNGEKLLRRSVHRRTQIKEGGKSRDRRGEKMPPTFVPVVGGGAKVNRERHQANERGNGGYQKSLGRCEHPGHKREGQKKKKRSKKKKKKK